MEDTTMQNKLNMLVKKYPFTAGIVGVLLLALSFTLITVIVASKQQSSAPLSVRRDAAKPAAPRARMWIEPEEITASVGKTTTVTIAVDARSTTINGLDVVLQYDPRYIEVISVEKVNDPQNKQFQLLRSFIEKNRVIATFAVMEGNNPPTARYVPLKVTVKALRKGATILGLEHFQGETTGSTIIKADGSENILDKVQGSVLVIE